jgi:hypothetical protein
MTSSMHDIHADKLNAAIDAVAKVSAEQTGRNYEWCRRRIREAVEFIQNNPRTEVGYAAQWALAEPVLVACMADGGFLDCRPVH